MDYIKGDYFIVPNRKALSGLDPQTQTIFLWLCARADDSGKCFPSYTNISRTSGVNRRTVIERIKKLEDLGFITKISGDYQNSNIYQIKVLGSESGLLGSAGDTLASAGDTLGVVQEIPSNNNHLTITKNERSSLSFLEDLDKETIKEMVANFKVDPAEVRTKANGLADYCRQKGKKYKDYKSLLRNALRKDFGERPPKTKKPIWDTSTGVAKIVRYE